MCVYACLLCRFRTQLCCFGASCRRRICFFAHSVSQMRVAPVVASPAGGAVMRRTQAVVPASVITSAETSVAAAAAAAGAAAGVFPAGQASLPAQMTAAVPCMPTSVMPGWVLTSQGWAAGCVDPTAAAPLPAEPAGASLSMQPMIAPGMAVSVARPPSAAVAAVAAADVSGLASSLGHLVLQPNQLPAASPGQLLPAPQVVLHGSTAYLAQTSMAASSSVPRSFGVSSSDQLENELCLPSGPVVNSASGSMVGYSSNSGSGTAFMHGGQAHELPYYPQPRHGPQGW